MFDTHSTKGEGCVRRRKRREQCPIRKPLEEELRIRRGDEEEEEDLWCFVRIRLIAESGDFDFIFAEFGALNRKNGYRNEKKQDLEMGSINIFIK